MATTRQPEGIFSFGEFHQKLLMARHEQFRGQAHAKVKNRAAFREMKDHLADFYDGVEVQHSFVDENGQIFDCIPFEQQPAVRKSTTRIPQPPEPPSPPGGYAGPPVAPLEPLRTGRQDRFGNNIECPPGTVPIRRMTLGELTRYPTLQQFFSKRRRRTPPPLAPGEPPPEAAGADGTHLYAHASQGVPNLGGRTILSVYSPLVTDDQDFSLAQLWYIGDGQGTRQTVEVGWHVWAPKFGHGSAPSLFTYWTRDNYLTTGSYNTDGGEFVLAANPPMTPGMALSSSVVGGNQVELEIIVALIQSNWWIYVGGGAQPQAIGSYPVSIYNGGPLATGATTIDYGGETDGITSHPAMGSGRLGSAGRGQAAYHRNIYYIAPGSGHQQPQLFSQDTTPAEYNSLLDANSDWATCLFFGGPGGV
jgi:hypothetical protein